MTSRSKAAKATLAAAEAEPWLTTADAADYMAVSPRALAGYISRGELVPDSPARPGLRLHRFKRSTLDAFLRGAKK